MSRGASPPGRYLGPIFIGSRIVKKFCAVDAIIKDSIERSSINRGQCCSLSEKKDPISGHGQTKCEPLRFFRHIQSARLLPPQKKMNGQPKFIDATSWPVCVNESEFSTRDAADIKLASIFFFQEIPQIYYRSKMMIFFPFSCKKKKKRIYFFIECRRTRTFTVEGPLESRIATHSIMCGIIDLRPTCPRVGIVSCLWAAQSKGKAIIAPLIGLFMYF